MPVGIDSPSDPRAPSASAPIENLRPESGKGSAQDRTILGRHHLWPAGKLRSTKTRIAPLGLAPRTYRRLSPVLYPPRSTIHQCRASALLLPYPYLAGSGLVQYSGSACSILWQCHTIPVQCQCSTRTEQGTVFIEYQASTRTALVPYPYSASRMPVQRPHSSRTSTV